MRELKEGGKSQNVTRAYDNVYMMSTTTVNDLQTHDPALKHVHSTESRTSSKVLKQTFIITQIPKHGPFIAY